MENTINWRFITQFHNYNGKRMENTAHKKIVQKGKSQWFDV